MMNNSQYKSSMYEAALHNLDAAVMVTSSSMDNEEHRIEYVNAAWVQLTGYSPDEALGYSPGLLGDYDFVADLIQEAEALEQGEYHMRKEVAAKHRDGTPFELAVSATRLPGREMGAENDDNTEILPGEQENRPCFVVFLRDVSKQQALMTRMRRLETLTHLQREVASADLDLDARRQKVVEVAMQVTGAESAVVEEAVGEELVYSAVAGDAYEQKGLRLPIQESVSGLAYRQRTPQLVQDVTRDDRVVFKQRAQDVGFRSGVLTPLICENRTYGVLKVLSREPNRFGEEQRLLLELASGVLAATLYNAVAYKNERERRGFLLDALPVYVSYIDEECRYQEVNTAYESTFGLTAEAIRGQYVWDILGNDGYNRIRPYLEAALRGERISYEMDVPLPSGKERILSADYVPSSDVAGKIIGVYAIVHDVTEARMGQTDFLTGLRNRRKFEELGVNQVAIARRYNTPLSLVMVDIDDFKTINDTRGHLTGDTVLKELGTLVNEVVRESDVAARWGGDEFVILLPHTDSANTEQMATRFSSKVRECDFSDVGKATVSCGSVSLESDENFESLVARADAALYKAKQEGRDCVRVMK